MAGDSSRRSRSRSRSPRRRDREHRDRDGDRRRDKDSRHRSGEHRDREHRDRGKERREETEEERQERKRQKRERERERDERRERRRVRDERGERKRDGVKVVDDDEAGDMWVEKDIDATNAVSTIPTADSLPLKSTAVPAGEKSPPARATDARRDTWMLGPQDDAQEQVVSSGGDFFSGLGSERRKEDSNKPDPSKLLIHKNELNKQLLEGKSVDEYETKEEKKVVPGGPGYQWRMMKLRRLYEQAEEQSRSIEDVAMERYGNLEDFNAAVEEKRYLDEKEARRKSRHGGSDANSSASTGMRTPDTRGGTPARRMVFNDDTRPTSRQGFRRPGEEAGTSTPSARVDALRREGGGGKFGTPASATPIPSVFTPQALTRGVSGETVPRTKNDSVMTIEQLNRLQAKVLRAKLSDDPDAEALEEHYERERGKFDEAGGAAAAEETGPSNIRTTEDGKQVQVEVLPTLDGRGHLYDVGGGKEDDPARKGKRKKEPKFETHDRQGNVLRYNADDDDMTLGEMVRQEKFGGGAADQKNLDAEMAATIARDGRFADNLDYMDENAEKLARKRMKTDAMKRAFAINDYKRTKNALDTCPFCWQDDRNPLTAIVALGKRAYLCCTTTEELVPGHCYIVPVQHCLSSLEMDDDDWEEVKNFMKCLMRMFAAENKGVLFYETILSFRQQRHTVIECVPLPAEAFADAPAYFRESIIASESEWSQHKKLIDFSTRQGGFRNMLVSKLPYFMVMWDYKGEKGYGHVIEGIDEAGGVDADDGMGGVIEGDVSGGRFPPYFAAEIIGNVLGLEPRKWLRPKQVDYALNTERARALGTKFQPYNWTLQLQEGS